MSFASSSSRAPENKGTHHVAVAISPAPTAPLTLSYILGGTATENADYSITGSGAISVATGRTSVNIPIGITDDTEDESNETIRLTLASGTGYTVGSTNVHTLTIVDNDDAPDTPVTVSLSASPNPVDEGASVTITATLSKPLPDAVTINLKDTPASRRRSRATMALFQALRSLGEHKPDRGRLTSGMMIFRGRGAFHGCHH